MNRSDAPITVYLDDVSQKRELRTQASARDLSMTEFAKRILMQALKDPLFLSTVSDTSDTQSVISSK